MSSPLNIGSFAQVYDLVIVGSGYAAVAAAISAKRKGMDKVCLVNRLPDILWESGRAFNPTAGTGEDALWQEWLELLASHNAMNDNGIDGASAEIIATDWLNREEIDVLYYVTPCAGEKIDGKVQSVVVGGKDGFHRIHARQWIDATETGEFARIIPTQTSTRSLVAYQPNAYLSAEEWTLDTPHPLTTEKWERAELLPSVWSGERRLHITVTGELSNPPRTEIYHALKALRDETGDKLADAVVSHCSLIPFPIYEGGNPKINDLPENVALAAPALESTTIATLADRFSLGLAAVAKLTKMPSAGEEINIKPIDISSLPVVRTENCGVLVAGVGTGGLMAAVAAARAGADVLGVEPLDCPGGIPAVGGVHWYCAGTAGGLQEELDRMVDKISPAYGKAESHHGFHPEARKVGSDMMLAECGMQILLGATICHVTAEAGSITHALAATPEGLVRLEAKGWIDGTGDGDLCAMAGAPFDLGREGDSLLHAYSQVGGRVEIREGKSFARHLNFDAGWTDPGDPVEMSRARVKGIADYLEKSYSDEIRYTYIAPALGLRQGRQIRTDYMLNLADLIEGRRFPDAVGYLATFSDNHATDMEFENDEFLFWVWGCRAWQHTIVSDIPYRCIIPAGFDNIWIACRAAGMTQNAHYGFRMQRDLQRLGEAAGFAAALCVTAEKVDCRQVPFDKLTAKLRETGALSKREDYLESTPLEHDAVKQGLESLQAGWTDDRLWGIYRAENEARKEVEEALASENKKITWAAAILLAAWGDSLAEERLLEAIATREYGFEDVENNQTPEGTTYLVPNWLTAVNLLRICGTRKCLPTLGKLAGEKKNMLNLRTSILQTMLRLVKRGVISPADREWVATRLQEIQDDPIPDETAPPRRSIGKIINELADGAASPDFGAEDTLNYRAMNNNHWQVTLSCLRLAQEFGLEEMVETSGYESDPRLLVRRAFGASA